MRNMLFLMLMLAALPAQAVMYTVQHDESFIRFSGTHAGTPFSGTFQNWLAEIDFDPANLSTSSILAEISTESATTGNDTYDKTLPKTDWFDVKYHPLATFQANTFRQLEDGTFQAEGLLDIKGVEKPFSLTFSLTPQTNGEVIMESRAVINRVNFGIGYKSDPTGEWVSPEIDLHIVVAATPHSTPAQ